MTVADLYRYPADRFGAASFVKSFGDRYEDKRQSRALRNRVQAMDYRPEDDPVRYMNDLLGAEDLTPAKRQEAIDTALPAIKEKTQEKRFNKQLEATSAENKLEREFRGRQDHQNRLIAQSKIINDQIKAIENEQKELAQSGQATPEALQNLRQQKAALYDANKGILNQLQSLDRDNAAMQQAQQAQQAMAPPSILDKPSEEVYQDTREEGLHDIALGAAQNAPSIKARAVANDMVREYEDNATKLDAIIPDDRKREGAIKGAKGLINNPSVSNVNKVKNNLESRNITPATLGAVIANQATYPGEFEIFKQNFPKNAEVAGWDDSMASTLKNMKDYREFARRNVTPKKISDDVRFMQKVRGLDEEERFKYGDAETRTVFSKIYDRHFKNNFDGFAGAVSQLIQKNLGLPVTKAQLMAQINEAISLEIDNDDAMLRLDQLYFIPLLENAFK